MNYIILCRNKAQIIETHCHFLPVFAKGWDSLGIYLKLSFNPPAGLMFPFRKGGHCSSQKKWHSMRKRGKKSWVMKAKGKKKNAAEIELRDDKTPQTARDRKVGWSSNWKEIEDWLYIRTRHIKKEQEFGQGRAELQNNSHLPALLIIHPPSSVPTENVGPFWQNVLRPQPVQELSSRASGTGVALKVKTALPGCSDGSVPSSGAGASTRTPRDISHFLFPHRGEKGRTVPKVCKLTQFVNKCFPSFLVPWKSDCCRRKKKTLC